MCYFNSAPLVHFLAEVAPNADVVLDVPSRLAQGLAAGELDVALVPSIEALRLCSSAGAVVVSTGCIACRGPVRSVKLFSKVPCDEIATLALDEGSRTSAALVRIFLGERYGCRPETVSLPLGDELDDSPADATMLIGDRALSIVRSDYPYVHDLGEAWFTWQGLPFVFAMWTARSGADHQACRNVLDEAATRGLNARDELATAWSARLGVDVTICREYLTENLEFHLGEDKRRSLRRFARLAEQYALLEPGAEIVYHQHLHTGSGR